MNSIFIPNRAIKLIVLWTVILAVVLLGGCGKTARKDKDEQGRTIISVGNWPPNEGKALDQWNARKDAFEKANPDVVVIPDPWRFDIKTF